MGPMSRLLLVLLAAALATPLVLVTRLRPSSIGLGTHQQLGLPPCAVRVVWGIPCPSCGMTTSWAHVVRGQGWSAMRASIGGTLLAVVDGVAVLVIARAAWSGHWPRPVWAVAAAWAMVLIWMILLTQWAWRLWG